MRAKENYSPQIFVALGLTLAILASFQIYISREPQRIAADVARDNLIAVSAGRTLYSENCAMCHGMEGEGVDGPPLNDKTFLQNNSDDRIFSVISSGVPSSEMPAWNQRFGGPYTDQEITQMVAFLRDWQEGAPDRVAEALAGDPLNGLVIYNSTCVVCHGEQGVGTHVAPMLNDPAKLGQLDDEWYIDTISAGRPAQGMPTWGTVLSPQDIRDLVALLRAWERGEVIEAPGVEVEVGEALHLVEHGDLHAAEHAIQNALEGATGEMIPVLERALSAAQAGDLTATEDALKEAILLLGQDAVDEHDESGESEDQHEDADQTGDGDGHND